MVRRFAARLVRGSWIALTALTITAMGVCSVPADEEATGDAQPVSYYRQVRPILQRNCAGCHQPAKLGGKLLLTSHEGVLKGGENGAGVVPGKPDESVLLDYITGEEPMMPLNGDPLKAEQVALISRWISEGAKDDSPMSAQDNVTAENPPQYSSPPVITALDYSPDSQLLAISGFHEILLHKADGSEPVARLIGRSQRIESLAFSPDGKILGAVGGTPALFGEVQFWNVAEKKLAASATVSHDTLFGGSFNNTGELFAFGAADNRVRVVKVEDASAVTRMDAHSDYVFGTTFSLNLEKSATDGESGPMDGPGRTRIVGKFAPGEYLISVSRDMSMKLTLVSNGQFIDNITSITPGALKGGLIAVERHPTRDEVLTGGADGEPKLYKIFRTQARVIGDDFNRIRGYEKLPGRIYDVEFNADGSRFVVGSSTATGGAARLYSTDDGKLLHNLAGITSPIFAVAFRPDGLQVAVAGFDGKVRLYDIESGQLVKEFLPVTLTNETAAK